MDTKNFRSSELHEMSVKPNRRARWIGRIRPYPNMARYNELLQKHKETKEKEES